MSTLNSSNIKIGQSITPANNITLSTSAGGDLVVSKGASEALVEITRIKNNGEMVYTPSGVGAVATTVQGKLRESVSVKDFGAATSASATANTTAINLALASGAVNVGIPADGVYSVNGVITIPSGVTLYGIGGKARIKLANSAYATNNPILYSISTTGFNIRDVEVDANQTNNIGQVSAVSVTNSTYFSVRGCTVLDSYYGIRVTNGNNMVISDNLVLTGKTYGISVKLATTTDSCSNVIIKDNQVINFATSAVAGPGVDGQGIVVYGATGVLLANYKNITNVTISGNICTGNAAHGITLIAVSDYSVTGNVCSGSVLNTDFGSGICVSEACINGTVSSNTCTGNYDAGILLDVVDQTATGNRFNYGYMAVTGNSCNANTRTGIKVNSMPHTTISGNNCSGSFYGIFLAKGGFNNIVANTISSCTQNGIRLPGVAGATGDDQTNIIVSDNIIDGIVASSNDQFSALFIDYFNTVRVQNNIFKGNTQDLTVQSTCSGVSLIDNKFTSNLFIDASASIIRWVDEFRTTASGKVFLSNEVSGDAMGSFRVDAAFTIPHFGLEWLPILSVTPVTSSLTTAIATGGFIGQKAKIINVNTNAITIKHNANTKNIGSVDIVLAYGEIVEFVWRGTQWTQTVAKVATSI